MAELKRQLVKNKTTTQQKDEVGKTTAKQKDKQQKTNFYVSQQDILKGKQHLKKTESTQKKTINTSMMINRIFAQI